MLCGIKGPDQPDLDPEVDPTVRTLLLVDKKMK